MTSTATATDAESPETRAERAETATDEVATHSETATDEAAKQEVERLEKLRGCLRCSSLWQQSQMAFCPNLS